MLRKMSIALVVLAFAAYGVSQTLQTRKARTPTELNKLTLNQLAAAARVYLRDSAEFPLHMQIRMVASSASGGTIKEYRGTGTYHFHGYNSRSGKATAQARLSAGFFHSYRSLLPAFRNSFVASMLPANILSGEETKEYSLEVPGPSGPGEVLIARIRRRSGCPEFEWEPEKSWTKQLCGNSRFEIQKGDLSLEHASFDAGGLPVATTVKPFGICELRGYHAEVEFQKVTLPDDPKPFLVPKHVEVVVETDKGKLDMTVEYTPQK